MKRLRLEIKDVQFIDVKEFNCILVYVNKIARSMCIISPYSNAILLDRWVYDPKRRFSKIGDISDKLNKVLLGRMGRRACDYV